jgi:hypothetical protein
MSKRKKVQKAVELTDKIAMDSEGGHPSQHVVARGKVYWAECVDGRAVLTVTSIKKFLRDSRI